MLKYLYLFVVWKDSESRGLAYQCWALCQKFVFSVNVETSGHHFWHSCPSVEEKKMQCSNTYIYSFCGRTLKVGVGPTNVGRCFRKFVFYVNVENSGYHFLHSCPSMEEKKTQCSNTYIYSFCGRTLKVRVGPNNVGHYFRGLCLALMLKP